MYYKDHGKLFKALSLGVFILYLAFLFRLTVFRDGLFDTARPDVPRLNLKPWDMYHRFLATGQYIQFRYLLVGNFMCLMPLGVACPFFRKDSGALFATLVCGGMTLFIESFQLVFNVGYFELDDLVLNLLGGITGYALFRCVERVRHRIKSK